MMLIGIMGKAGSGKSTAAKYLCQEYGFTEIGFADPMKRFCMDVFGWTPEQLWGPSELRELPDLRYPRKYIMAADQGGYVLRTDCLTPRHALQTLGTEWGRSCFENVWADKALALANQLRTFGGVYESAFGYWPSADHTPKHVVIPDVRFENEAYRIREEDGVVIRLRRQGVRIGVHASETAQDGVPKDLIDYDICADSIQDMQTKLSLIVAELRMSEAVK